VPEVKKSSAKFSTLVAVGGSLAALPATALELGEAQVNSSLGQPLRASIAYALAPNETLLNSCVSLHSGLPQNGMPTVNSAAISVSNGVISVVGKTPIREPLVTMRVNIRCAYTANLSREYMLFIDPAGTPAQVAATQTIAAPATAQPTAAAQTPVATRRRPASIATIEAGTRHQVRFGETLSEIAQAIVDRPVGLWTAVGEIFDANPDAFIDNDPNKLKAGSWLTIPDFSAAATTVADTAIADAIVVAEVPQVSESVAVDSSSVEPELQAQPAVDIVEDNPYVAPISSASDTVVSIPDTALESPQATSSSPNVPVASVQTTVAEEPSGFNWLLWLAGAGIALIGGLLFFGRLLRERFGSTPIAAVGAPTRRRSDGNTQKTEAVSEIEVELDELSATHESLAIDADLKVGTGLQKGNDIDVVQDFGFTNMTELDFELPEEMSSSNDLSSDTSVIPPLNVEMESILDSEVLPDDDDIDTEVDDYDMSMIVDATKVPLPDDATQKDFEAIAVETSNEKLITGDYTLNHEVDYKVLEQDYEDEFTASQVLNDEISRVAAQLATRMDEAFGDEEDTMEMSLASVTTLDVTAQLPVKNDDISDLDNTGVNEDLTINMSDIDGTVEMQADDSTMEMPADDSTMEMPAKKGNSA
jgi:hypothetical protein